MALTLEGDTFRLDGSPVGYLRKGCSFAEETSVKGWLDGLAEIDTLAYHTSEEDGRALDTMVDRIGEASEAFDLLAAALKEYSFDGEKEDLGKTAATYAKLLSDVHEKLDAWRSNALQEF